MDNEKLRKIFVGNVSYECTQDIFENTFRNMDGFINAEIVADKSSGTCRGFGFVTLNTSENARKLLKKTDININGRELRLTQYTSTQKYTDIDRAGYICVDNIPDNCNRSYLKELFAGYPLGKHYIITDIYTGEPKNNGIVEILSVSKYKELVSSGFITDKNGNQLKLYTWA
jgi:RNA recognition motif-containing protein